MNQSSRQLVQSLANEDLKLEFSAAQRVQQRLAEARNQLASELAKNPANWQANRLAPVLDVYLGQFETDSTADLRVGQSLSRGINNGRLLVAEAAEIPNNSNYWNWTPTIPVNAISLAESEATERIKRVSQQVRQDILRRTQVGLALGAPLSQLEDDILGVGLKGIKGRDGVFRSASVRAETIARTTSNELINRGALLTYTQVDNKVPELNLRKIWQTISDRRTSDVCISLSGQIKPLDQPFSGSGWSGMHPPAHPNCRSRVTSMSEKYSEEYESRWPLNADADKGTSKMPPVPKGQPRQPKGIPLANKTVLSTDPSITQEAVQAAFEGLPQEQSEFILGFLRQSDVQLIFANKNHGEAWVDKLLGQLKYTANPTIGGPANIRKSVGFNRDAKGYTWEWANHINVRLSSPQVGFDINHQAIQLQTKGVLNRSIRQPDNLVLSFSSRFADGSPEQIFSTLIHEIGHQVQYKTVGSKAEPPLGAKWFTKYGDPTKSPKEWHAEAFRLWATSPTLYAKLDPIGFEYIQGLTKMPISFAHIPQNMRLNTPLANRK